MPSARFAKRTGLFAIPTIVGIFVFWLYPIHFGLSRTAEDPFLISSMIGYSPNPMPPQPLRDFQNHSVYYNVYENVPDIEKLIPANNPHGPIPLTPDQINAILPHLPPPQLFWIDLTPLQNFPDGAVWLNSEMRSWVDVISFITWSDQYHRFLDHSLAIYRNINPFVEGKIRDSKITIRMTLISKANPQCQIQSPDLPPGINHLGQAKYEMDYAVGEFPIDQHGTYAFKIKAQPTDLPKNKTPGTGLPNNALVILDIHPNGS